MGEKVYFYVILNELFCLVYLGYEVGIYVFGKIGMVNGWKVVYYLLFVYGLVLKVFNWVCLKS